MSYNLIIAWFGSHVKSKTHEYRCLARILRFRPFVGDPASEADPATPEQTGYVFREVEAFQPVLAPRALNVVAAFEQLPQTEWSEVGVHVGVMLTEKHLEGLPVPVWREIGGYRFCLMAVARRSPR